LDNITWFLIFSVRVYFLTVALLLSQTILLNVSLSSIAFDILAIKRIKCIASLDDSNGDFYLDLSSFEINRVMWAKEMGLIIQQT